MTAEARVNFPKTLQEIRERHARGDYQGAAQITHECYEWAIGQSDFCEITGPGFAYFPMPHNFKSLEKLLREPT